MKALTLALLFLFAAMAQPASNFVLVAHGGAGDFSQITPQAVGARRDLMPGCSQSAAPVFIPPQ